MAEILVSDITEGKIDGDGVFDELMKSINAHLDHQYSQNRLRGADYSKVYLGSMEAAMAQSILFLLGRQKADKEADHIEEETKKTILEAALVAKQIEKMDSEICVLERECENKEKEGLILDEGVDKAKAEVCIAEATCLKVKEETKSITQAIANAIKEGVILDVQDDKVIAETALIDKQHDKIVSEIQLTDQQILNMIKEGVILDVQDDKIIEETKLITKQHQKVDSEIRMTDQQILNLQKEGVILDVQDDKVIAETGLIEKQHDKIDSDIKMVDQQVLNLKSEKVVIDVQDDKVIAETRLINKQHDKVDSEINMTDAQIINLGKEGKVLDEQDDKVRAETNLIGKQGQKIDAEIPLVQSEINKTNAEVTHLGKQNQMLDKQILKMTDEIQLVKKQVINTEMENLLLSVKGSVEQLRVLDDNIAWYNPLEGIWGTVKVTGTEINEREKLDAQTALLLQQTQNAAKENELLDAQKDKLVAESFAAYGSYYTAYARIADTIYIGEDTHKVTGPMGAERDKTKSEKALIDKKLVTETKQQAILDQQKLKIDSETDLIIVKSWVELAQIQDQVHGITVTGLVGKKKKLYDSQAEGYLRDAEQKASKIVMDSWSVRKTVSEETDSPVATDRGPLDSMLNNLLTKAKLR